MINSQTILRTGDIIQHSNQECVIHLVIEKSGQSSFEGRVKECQSVVAHDGDGIKEIEIGKISLLKGDSVGNRNH